MYEKLQSQFILKLSDKFSSEDINVIINELNSVMYGYDVIQKERGVAVVDYTMPAAAQYFMACKKMEGYADGTLNNYKDLLMNFFMFVRKDVNEVSTNDIRMFLYEYQKIRSVSNRTMDKYQQNLKAFFTWCFNEGHIDKNISYKLKPIKYEEKPRQALTQIELETVRSVCSNIRDKAIVEFIYSTGCRVSELCGVKKNDVNWHEKTVHLFGKGSKHRTSFLNAKAEFTLKQYLESREDDSEYLFVSLRKPHDKLKKCGVEKMFRDLSEKAKLDKKLTPHILRHTTATTGLSHGMPIDEIQKMLGHESVNTTLIYAKTNLDNVKISHKKYIV